LCACGASGGTGCAGATRLAKLPEDAFLASFDGVAKAKRDGATDGFGRNWAAVAPLVAPFCAVRVTGALFHSQGGLVVQAQVASEPADERAHGWPGAVRWRSERQRSEQYLTSSHTLLHFLRQVNGRPQLWQVFWGRSCFLLIREPLFWGY
jgi:hypothetical protein